MFKFVHLAVGSRGCVNCAWGTGSQGLYLKLFRFKDDCGSAVGSDAVEAGGGAGSHEYVAGIIGCNCPDVGGRGGIQVLESGCEREASRAADGHAGGGALGQFVKLRLFPGAGALGRRGWNQPREGEIREEKSVEKEEGKLLRTRQVQPRNMGVGIGSGYHG